MYEVHALFIQIFRRADFLLDFKGHNREGGVVRHYAYEAKNSPTKLSCHE